MAYSTDGFEVIPLLPMSVLEGIRQVIGERIDAAARARSIRFDSSFPEEGIGRRLERIACIDNSLAESLLLAVYTEAHLDERIAFLDGYPPLRAIAEKLVGKEISSFTIRVRANVPSIPAKRQGWHSDVSILDGGEFSKVRIACWLPLANANIHNGTLEVVPGIRSGPMAHDGDEWKHTIRDQDLEDQKKVIVECDQGSALFLDSFAPHRAIPNLSDEVRWSVVTWMMT